MNSLNANKCQSSCYRNRTWEGFTKTDTSAVGFIFSSLSLSMQRCRGKFWINLLQETCDESVVQTFCICQWKLEHLPSRKFIFGKRVKSFWNCSLYSAQLTKLNFPSTFLLRLKKYFSDVIAKFLSEMFILYVVTS